MGKAPCLDGAKYFESGRQDLYGKSLDVLECGLNPTMQILRKTVPDDQGDESYKEDCRLLHLLLSNVLQDKVVGVGRK